MLVNFTPSVDPTQHKQLESWLKIDKKTEQNKVTKKTQKSVILKEPSDYGYVNNEPKLESKGGAANFFQYHLWEPEK